MKVNNISFPPVIGWTIATGVIEASEQSNRINVPTIANPQYLNNFLKYLMQYVNPNLAL